MDPPILGRHGKRSQRHKGLTKNRALAFVKDGEWVSTLYKKREDSRSLCSQEWGSRLWGCWDVTSPQSPLNSGCWCKDSMPWWAGEVPDTEDRAIVLACRLLELNAVPVTCSGKVSGRLDTPGPPAQAPRLTWSKVCLPIEAHNPLLLACNEHLVSDLSLGPVTLQTAQGWR